MLRQTQQLACTQSILTAPPPPECVNVQVHMPVSVRAGAHVGMGVCCWIGTEKQTCTFVMGMKLKGARLRRPNTITSTNASRTGGTMLGIGIYGSTHTETKTLRHGDLITQPIAVSSSTQPQEQSRRRRDTNGRRQTSTRACAAGSQASGRYFVHRNPHVMVPGGPPCTHRHRDHFIHGHQLHTHEEGRGQGSRLDSGRPLLIGLLVVTREVQGVPTWQGKEVQGVRLSESKNGWGAPQMRGTRGVTTQAD